MKKTTTKPKRNEPDPSGAPAPTTFNGGKPFTVDIKVSLKVIAIPEKVGGFSIIVPALPNCVSQALTFENIVPMATEVVELCLDVEGAPGQALEFVGIERVTIAA